jgi:site-specific DNA-methyltransferase (adenine-specific)
MPSHSLPNPLMNINKKTVDVELPREGLIAPLVREVYSSNYGQLYNGDSIRWLKSIPSSTIDLVFADPPYNIKKADWDYFHSNKQYLDWSMEWVTQVHRILKPTGTFYVCGFSEIIAEFVSPCMEMFDSLKWLIWHYKNKGNLGNDWGRSHESILHFRKSNNFTFNTDAVRIPYNFKIS